MTRKENYSEADRRRFLQLSGLATASGLTMLAGCSGGSSEQDTTDTTASNGTESPTEDTDSTNSEVSGAITVSQTYDPETLDPAKYSNITSMQIANNIYDALLDFKIGTAELQSGLAKDWSFVQEGQSIEFTLKEGVQFHKGYGELTTADVEAHFNRISNPDSGSVQAAPLEQVGYEGIEAQDDYNFRLNFSTAANAVPFLVAQSMGMIPSADAVDEKGQDFDMDPIGTGPFEFESFEPNTLTTLSAFEDYHRAGRPKVETVQYRPIPEDQTAWSSYRSGEIDLKRVNSAERLEQLQNQQDTQLPEATGLITRFVGFNHNVEPFDNKKVRQALNYAANSAAISNEIFPGLSTPASSFIAPGVEYHTTENVPTYEYDLDQARSLLEEAGYGDGFDTTFWVPQISRFTKPATVFQNSWEQIGVNVDVQIKETGSYISTIIGSEHDVPMFSHSLGQDPVPDSFVADQFHSSNLAPDGSNYWFYENEQVDQWIDEATATTDDQRRQELFANIQQQLSEDAVGVWIDHEKFIFAVKNRVNGFESDPMRRIELETSSVSE